MTYMTCMKLLNWFGKREEKPNFLDFKALLVLIETDEVSSVQNAILNLNGADNATILIVPNKHEKRGKIHTNYQIFGLLDASLHCPKAT